MYYTSSFLYDKKTPPAFANQLSNGGYFLRLFTANGTAAKMRSMGHAAALHPPLPPL